MNFSVGDKVEHILSGDWMLVLNVNNSLIQCRTKDLREVWLNDWELKKIR